MLASVCADVRTRQAGPSVAIERNRFGKGVIRERQPLGERVNLHACHQRRVSARISVQIEKAQVLIGRLEGGAVVPEGIVSYRLIPGGADELRPASGVTDLAGGPAVAI